MMIGDCVDAACSGWRKLVFGTMEQDLDRHNLSASFTLLEHAVGWPLLGFSVAQVVVVKEGHTSSPAILLRIMLSSSLRIALFRTMELDGMNDVRRLKVPAAIKIHRVATFPLHNFIPAIKTTSSRLPHITSRHLPSSIQFVQTAPAHTTGSVLFLPKILLLYFYIPQLTRIHNHHHFIPSCPD